MYLILYNPISRNGKKVKKVYRYFKYNVKKESEKIRIKSLLNIKSPKDFLSNLKKETKVILFGGDGTLNRLINEVYGSDLPELYLYTGGTGNDFRRSIKEKGKFIKINEYLNRVPYVKYNNQQSLFLNGIGLGVDGSVCEKVNLSRANRSKSNFFGCTIKALREYKPKKMSVTIDGIKREFNKCYLISVLNGPYMGGGMKFSPNSNRLDDVLEVLVAHDITTAKILRLFPSIYRGKHLKYKEHVTLLSGKEIIIESSEDSIMQIDGEHHYNIKKIEVRF